MARPHLQAQPRGQGARYAWPIRQAIKAVRLDPCDGVSLGERDLRRRTVELARAEADPEAVATAVVGSLSRLRRAVRGKLRIFEPQLIDREFGFGLARIDWRRLVDFCDRTSHEQSLADEFCKAQIENFQGIQTLREAQEQIGDHRGDDLQADSVAVVADELTKIEMLLDPAEQQFNLPAPLVEGRNLDCGAFEIVGDEGDGPALITFDLDASQRDRQLGIALAGEHDIIIGDDSEAVAYDLAHVPGLRLAQAGVHLDACDEESLGSVDLLPPAKMIVALVEDVGRAGFEFRLTADLDVVDGRIRHLDATRDIVPRMIDVVHLL